MTATKILIHNIYFILLHFQMLDEKKTCMSFAQKRMAGDKNMLVKTVVFWTYNLGSLC